MWDNKGNNLNLIRNNLDKRLTYKRVGYISPVKLLTQFFKNIQTRFSAVCFSALVPNHKLPPDSPNIINLKVEQTVLNHSQP